MGNKKDIRSVNTEEALMNCLAELLAQKDIKKISVRELTAAAGIHRATFYDHFTDIYDLFDKMMDAFFEKLKFTLTDDSVVSYSDFYCAIIDILLENKQIGKMVSATPSILNKVENLFYLGCLDVWKEEKHIESFSKEMLYLAKYRVNGCIGILKFWIQNDYNDSPDYLKKYIATIDEIVDANLEQ